MASGVSAAPGMRLVTDATAPAAVPRTSVAAFDSADGLGGGLRSRRLRDAADRAAVFFFAVLAFFAVLVAARLRADVFLTRLRAVFVFAALRVGFRVVRFATLTSTCARSRRLPVLRSMERCVADSQVEARRSHDARLRRWLTRTLGDVVPPLALLTWIHGLLAFIQQKHPLSLPRYHASPSGAR